MSETSDDAVDDTPPADAADTATSDDASPSAPVPASAAHAGHPAPAADETTAAETAAQTLVGISFDDVFRAREFMTAATGMGARKELVLRDVVLVVKDDEGRTTVTETTDPQGKQSAFSGAVWAGLFGLILGGPVGWAAGAAVGAGAGAVAAKVIDVGVSDEWVEWFRAAVLPGTATVVLLITDYDADALVREAARFTGSHLVYANVDDALLARLHEALGQEEGSGS